MPTGIDLVFEAGDSGGSLFIVCQSVRTVKGFRQTSRRLPGGFAARERIGLETVKSGEKFLEILLFHLRTGGKICYTVYLNSYDVKNGGVRAL